MIRQLLILIVLVAGYWLLRRLWRRLLKQRRATAAEPPYQAMVRCPHCGLHVPLDKALGNPQTGYFCCEAHRRAWQPPPDNR